MERIGTLKFAYLAFLSQPSKDRVLYRAIRRRRVARILEIGVGQGIRSQRMITAASLLRDPADIRYVGLDLFESRPAHAAGLTLKRAHQVLAASGAQTRLLPGDPDSSLARAANSLTGTDLIVIGADPGPESLQKAWFYFPRMLHENALVLWDDGRAYREMTSSEIGQRAKQAGLQRGRAA